MGQTPVFVNGHVKVAPLPPKTLPHPRPSLWRLLCLSLRRCPRSLVHSPKEKMVGQNCTPCHQKIRRLSLNFPHSLCIRAFPIHRVQSDGYDLRWLSTLISSDMFAYLNQNFSVRGQIGYFSSLQRIFLSWTMQE